jgi:hypothetical protein
MREAADQSIHAVNRLRHKLAGQGILERPLFSLTAEWASRVGWWKKWSRRRRLNPAWVEQKAAQTAEVNQKAKENTERSSRLPKGAIVLHLESSVEQQRLLDASLPVEGARKTAKNAISFSFSSVAGSKDGKSKSG